MTHPFASVLLALAIAGAAFAAPPEIPDQVPYSAVLPGGGSDPVDLTIRIYDAATSGTLLYVQDFADVPLADGAFTLALGPTGRATDSPTDPLTTSLVTALAADLAATGPARFVEITVDADPPLARTQVLAVPFALRAAAAETAESADAVTQVGGLPPEVLAQIYENADFGDGGPPNTDPSEGVGDTDGDGIANFVDSDNDADAQSDTAEVAQGSDINLITPTIAGFVPSFVPFGGQGTVQVQGTFFEPGLTVVFGTQMPTPSNVTSTSFDVLVGPQTGLATVTVTRLNGESDSATFNFGDAPPFEHSASDVPGSVLDFDVFGSLLLVGRGFGLSSGSHSVSTGAEFGGILGSSDLATALTPDGRVAAARMPGSFITYTVDTDGDFSLTDETNANIETGVSVAHASLVFDPSGRPAVGYMRTGSGTQPMLARDLNADGDFADAGELVQIQTFAGTVVRRSELAFDASGRAVYAYQTSSSNTLRIAYDRSGDGDFGDTVGGTAEISLVSGGSGNTDCFGVSFDSAGRLVLAYQNPTNGAPILARDGNGDGDVNDAGERTELAASVVACDVERMASGGLQFVYGGSGLVRLRDTNDDGDFTDEGESLTLLSPATAVTAVEIGSEAWTATQRNVYFAP
jgi:hypothetical protein